MSRENIEAMRRLVEATAARDYDSAVADLDPDVEIDDTDITESTGADSFHQWLARWDAAWESWRVEDLELLPCGEDKVLALFRMIVKGKGSGIELERDDAVLGEFRGERIVRLGYYNDQERAREAAGLSE
jgi:ketosteroid isomerase-like protein